MRENRTYGSEGGEAKSLPYPYRLESGSGAQRHATVNRHHPPSQSPYDLSLTLCNTGSAGGWIGRMASPRNGPSPPATGRRGAPSGERVAQYSRASRSVTDALQG
jgi:hypothetical protein